MMRDANLWKTSLNYKTKSSRGYCLRREISYPNRPSILKNSEPKKKENLEIRVSPQRNPMNPVRTTRCILHHFCPHDPPRISAQILSSSRRRASSLALAIFRAFLPCFFALCFFALTHFRGLRFQLFSKAFTTLLTRDLLSSQTLACIAIFAWTAWILGRSWWSMRARRGSDQLVARAKRGLRPGERHQKRLTAG